jgi:hypothetical protein
MLQDHYPRGRPSVTWNARFDGWERELALERRTPFADRRPIRCLKP